MTYKMSKPTQWAMKLVLRNLIKMVGSEGTTTFLYNLREKDYDVLLTWREKPND